MNTVNTGQSRTRFLVAVVLASLVGSPHGQEILRTYRDVWSTRFIAAPLGSVDDIDAGGARDLIVGDSSFAPYGEVRLLSGETGNLLNAITFQDFKLGRTVVGLGDVTGDGQGDFMASGWVGGLGHVWSGADLKLAWTGQRFDSGASIGDIDGDGIGDFLVAGFGLVRSQGSATVYYGARFSPAYSVSPPGAVHFGYASAAMGDVDGDGIGDYAIGAPGGLTDEVCVPGAVYVYSGADGHVLYSLQGEGVDSFFGGAVASPGDVTGDGRSDLVVGARFCCPTFCSSLGQGRVSFYEGRKGRLLGHVLGKPFGGSGLTQFGTYLISVGDLDGNGYGDILTNFNAAYGPQGRLTGTLVALDGGSRQPIYRMWNPYADVCPGFGIQVAAAGDVDGDDFPDFFVSTACSRAGQPDDRIDVVSGAPRGVRTLGGRCGELQSVRSLRIGATGVPEMGRNYPIHLSGIEPDSIAWLLLGDLAQSNPRLASRSKCTALVQSRDIRLALAKTIRPGEGVATELVSIPNVTDLIGTRFHAQWLIGGPRRWSTSRVLEIEIQAVDPHRGW